MSQIRLTEVYEQHYCAAVLMLKWAPRPCMTSAVMIVSVLFFSLLLNLPAFAIAPGLLSNTILGFKVEADTLCFQNASPIIEELGPRPFGRVGSREGICQGMAGVSAAFFQHAQFEPTQTKRLTQREARRRVHQLIRLHKNNCPTNRKVKFPGYTNLKSFCKDYTNVLVDRATLYNFGLVMREVFKDLPQFLIQKNIPITRRRHQRQLNRTLESIHQSIESGEPALLLYHSHVVMVYGFEVHKNSNGRPDSVNLLIYDSNMRQPAFPNSIPHHYTVHLTSEGEVAMGQPLFWDITPNRVWQGPLGCSI